MKITLIHAALITAMCTTQMACSEKSNDTSKAKAEQPASTLIVPTFTDVSSDVGIVSEPAWKYGGPSVSDINNDGYYDFLLTNHDTTPVELYLSKGDGTYAKQPDIFERVDLHGIASGDYDADGDNDILLSLGGGNGLTPQPQRLLRNDNGVFVDATVEAGISEMGARGRAVRWVDLDNDGDLDFLQVNAEKVVNESAPRNILFANNGDGTFTYFPSPSFEEIDAERVLVTDFNNDGVPDLLLFNSYSNLVILKGEGDFSFTDVTESILPENVSSIPAVISVAQADIDNDGDLDYYLARGKLYYTIANNAVSFDEAKGRLDLRDQGMKSQDGMTLLADGDISLTDFYHFPRGKLMEKMPVFIGKNKTPIETPVSLSSVTREDAAGFPESITDTGWYFGYLGDGKWRMEWLLSDNLAWDIRASVIGITGYNADWAPQDLGVPDVLLRNDNGKFTDISSVLPDSVMTNNWGVTTGDFNNNGYNDFFVYRFGELRQRVADVMLINKGDGTFMELTEHGATTAIGQNSHGDMGTAFDYNLDGKIDILSGDDDNGTWHMYRNDLAMSDASQYLITHIGYSDTGIDPLGATVSIETVSGKQYKLVGSSSASHSQSVLNIAHFGLGANKTIKSVDVKWRDGSQKSLTNIQANQILKIGKIN